MRNFVPLTLALSLLLTPVLGYAETTLDETGRPVAQAEAIATPQPSNIEVNIKEELYGKKQQRAYFLLKKYDMHQLIIKNNRQTPVTIMEAALPNHIAPELAQPALKKSAGQAYAKDAAAGILFAPLSFGVTIPLMLFVGGPLDAACVGSYNKAVLKYLNQHPGQIPLDTIQPGESKQYGLITEYGVKPVYTLTIQDIATKEVFTLPE